MKYLLLLIFIVGLVNCQNEDEVDLHDKGKNLDLSNSDVIAYFPLDSSYIDESGNDNLLQPYGNPEFAEGYRNEPSTAVLLDGDDDFLVGFIGKLDTFSLSMWLLSYRYYVGEWPEWRSTVFDYSNKQVYGYIDGVSGATQLNCEVESKPVAGADIDNVNDWFHLYVAVSNDVKIYINGSLKKTVPNQDTITYLSDIIYFGRASSDDEIELTYFYGLIDEIRIFNRILDQTEIEELSSKL